MALRDFVAFASDRDLPPITAQMVGELAEAFSSGGNGGYDQDSAFEALALAVLQLEGEIAERRRENLNLESRILQTGLQLGSP